jgi:hypothetical protein
MRVIYKLTGQTGTIPDDKYDPNLFSEIGATNVQAPVKPQIPQQQTIGSALNPVFDFAGKASNFLFPKTTEAAIRAPQTAQVAQQMAQYEQQNPAKNISEWLGRQQGRTAIQAKTTLPVAGELAPWVMGGIPKENRALTGAGRIKQAAQLGGYAGGARTGTSGQGAQDIIDNLLLKGNIGGAVTSGVQTLQDVLPGAVFGSLVGGTLQTGIEGAKTLGRTLQDAGLSGFTGKVQPQTGSTPGFARREEAAAKQVLTKTTALTPRGMDKQIQDNLQNLNDAIKGKLEENKQPVIFSSGGGGTSDIEGKMAKDVERSVSGFSLKDKIQTEDFQKILKFFTRKTQNVVEAINPADKTAPVGNIAQQTITASDLFKGKQDLGNWLGQNGVWNKLSKGIPLQQDEKIGLAVYNSTKEVIDDVMGGNISDLTNAEHMLYQAGSGIYEMAHRGGSTNPSVFAVYKFPILGLIPNALDAISILGNRAMWTVGQALQSGDPQMEQLVLPIVNMLMGSTNKNTSKNSGIETKPKNNNDMRIKASQAQQAIDTAPDTNGTYQRIIGAEPELAPYIHP